MTRSFHKIIIPMGMLACLVPLLTGCDPEDKPKPDQIKAAIQANPELAKQVAEQLRASGIELDDAGKKILTSSQSVRQDIAVQAPALAPTTTPKLDTIDANANVVIDQAQVIDQQRLHTLHLESNIRQIGEERDDFAKRLNVERQKRIDDHAKFEKELAAANSWIFTLMYGLGALCLVAAGLLVALGIWAKNGWIVCGGIGSLIMGGLLIGVGMYLKLIVISSLILFAVVLIVLGVMWWLEKRKANADKSMFDGLRNSADGTRQLLTTRNRMFNEVVQLVEHLKTKITPEYREELFGDGTSWGKVPLFLNDDTIDFVDETRRFHGIKKAPPADPTLGPNPPSIKDAIVTPKPS